MGKHEAPAFRMVIEGGRLVPATAYDAERLDTYRRGTKVFVRFTEEKDRVLVRKWWAIIGKAVKECSTPWKTRDEASEAIKLALGIVNLTKTVGGDWLQYPKSLTELTDPELTEAVEQMVEIIHHVTGVDPDTWRKEIAHVGEDEPSDAIPPSDAGSGEPAQASPIPAADQTAGNGEAEAGDTGAQAEPDASSASDLTQEDRDWLKLVAKTLWAATAPGEGQTLKNQFTGVRENHTPETIGKAARDKGMSILRNCSAVCDGTQDMGDTLELIAGIAGVEAREIVS